MIFLRYYLWLVPHLLLAVTLVGAWRRGLHRYLPFFRTFGLFELLQFLTLFALSTAQVSLSVYRWALAFGSAVTMILQIGVIFELAGRLLLSRVTLSKGLRALMRWTIGGLVLVAAAASGSFAALAPNRELRVFEVVDFSSSLIQVGLLFVLLAFSRALHISWRSWPTGVAVGFGVLASIDLGTAAIRSTVGESAFIPVDITQMT